MNLMLAHNYDGRPVDGWLISEKLDGVRAFWDGGMTVGMDKGDVPWANCLRDKRRHYSTGLWSRYGNVIYAPKWWTDLLPRVPLDGELWTGREDRQNLMSIVRSYSGDGWEAVQGRWFDAPPIALFCQGVWAARNVTKLDGWSGLDWPYCRRAEVFGRYLNVEQLVEGSNSAKGEVVTVDGELRRVAGLGGEGVMVRDGGGLYVGGRSWGLLKVKDVADMEVTVVGWEWGKGKYEGMMGSLLCETDAGVRVGVSGFTDLERLDGEGWVGRRITVRYRGLTTAGVPVECRYWRLHDEC